MTPSELEELLRSPLAFCAAFVFGALWGSFWNVCIARVPRGMSVVRPGSHCFACGKPVRFFDNVPFLSYLLLRGRCRACGARFSARYLLVELIGGLAALGLWALFVAGDPEAALGVRAARFVVYFAFTGVLTVLSFIDLDTKRLPDVITLPSVVVFYAAGFGTHDASWSERAIGAGAGYLAVRLIGDAYYYLRGREGLGLGDGKLLAVMGALLGWKALIPVIFFASLVGVVVSVPILLYQRGRQPAPAPAPPAGADEDEVEAESLAKSEVPFGPFLAASALAYLFGGRAIWEALMGA